MRLALAQINPIVGAFDHNRALILQNIALAKQKGASLLIFPEMAICGYPPEDLLLLPTFIARVEAEIQQIQAASKGICLIVGCVRKHEGALLNSACVIEDGQLVAFYDKMLLPDYDVFSERRYFTPGEAIKIIQLKGKRIALTICEDLWAHVGYGVDPVSMLQEQNVDLVVNLAASPFYIERHQTRLAVAREAVKKLGSSLCMVNQVGANDRLIFDGHSLCLDDQANLVALAKGFEEDLLFIDLDKKSKPITWKLDAMRDLHDALILGLRDYFGKQGLKKAILGLSGGIDSALVAVLAVRALGKENVTALFMPSRYTSEASGNEARALAKNLNITLHQISIEAPFDCFLELLAPSFEGLAEDTTEENLQARIRGMLLMAFSNKFGSVVLGTGNKSEMAMGYATLYGDMCGGLGVIADLTKEQVWALARWINQTEEVIPKHTIEKEPSAELRVNQKDRDTLPDYAIVDCVLQEYVEEHLSAEEIATKHQLDLTLVRQLIGKIHKNEYKRQQAAPALRVTKKAFTKGRRFPIVEQWDREAKDLPQGGNSL